MLVSRPDGQGDAAFLRTFPSHSQNTMVIVKCSLVLVCLILIGCNEEEHRARLAQKHLSIVYAAIEEGNDHEAAIESVEAGLGGNGESSMDVKAFEEGSAALLRSLKKTVSKAPDNIAMVGTKSDLLKDIKFEALSRLEQKIKRELEKETGALQIKVAARNHKPTPAGKAAAHKMVAMVKQKLTALTWSYSGSMGPSDWGQLGFSLCTTGRLQSPIDIQTISSTTKAIDILNIAVLDWQFPTSTGPDGSASGLADDSAAAPKLFLDLPVNSRFDDGGGGQRRLLNYLDGPTESFDGRAFTVGRLGPATLFADGAAYALRELRVHTPSEHRIDGTTFDLELQLIHTRGGGGGGGGEEGGAASRHLIVSMLFNSAAAGAPPPFLAELVATIGQEHFGSTPRWLARGFSFHEAAAQLRGSGALSSYFKYRGSLTAPPCTEDVTWFVVRRPLAVAPEALQALVALQGRNARPVQPAHDRLVEFTP